MVLVQMPESFHKVRRRYSYEVAREPQVRAVDDLRFIRQTMERSGSFTASPGVGHLLAGLLALFGAWLAHRQSDRSLWMDVWLGTATLSVLVLWVATQIKARRNSLVLTSGPAMQFALSFLPVVFAAATLTAAVYPETKFLPGLWLLLYGTAVFTGGAFSISLLRQMGAAFMVVGLIALFAPPRYGDLCMAIGFGGLHIVFGYFIARCHGG
jgi:hypothetical protein